MLRMRIIPAKFKNMLPSKALLVPALVIAALGSGCGPTDEEAGDQTESLSVVAAFYPLEEAARRVGGDRVDVVGLTPPGSGPHDLELTPRSAEQIEQADVIVYLSGGFQPAVEQALESVSADVSTLDVLEGMDLLAVEDGLAGTNGEVDGEELEGGLDPHVWVDPQRQVEIAASVASTLEAADPDGAEEYRANLADYQGELETLASEFDEGLAECESRVIVTSHRAFAYLADTYDLDQIAIAGISPDDEPDPQSLRAVADEARRSGVSVVFFEEAVPQGLSETVANEIGATTDFLQPVETITQPDLDAGIDYTAIQRQNLESLQDGLRCS